MEREDFISQKIKPAGNRLIIQIRDLEERIGGIILPDKYQEGLFIADVLAVGDKVERFNEGDVVIVNWYTGIPIDFPECKLKKINARIIVEDEILAEWRG